VCSSLPRMIFADVTLATTGANSFGKPMTLPSTLNGNLHSDNCFLWGDNRDTRTPSGRDWNGHNKNVLVRVGSSQKFYGAGRNGLRTIGTLFIFERIDLAEASANGRAPGHGFEIVPRL